MASSRLINGLADIELPKPQYRYGKCCRDQWQEPSRQGDGSVRDPRCVDIAEGARTDDPLPGFVRIAEYELNGIRIGSDIDEAERRTVNEVGAEAAARSVDHADTVDHRCPGCGIEDTVIVGVEIVVESAREVAHQQVGNVVVRFEREIDDGIRRRECEPGPYAKKQAVVRQCKRSQRDDGLDGPACSGY